jgi:cyclophilin family peptidyl-prolyl cis-trans isomerase
MTGTRRSLAGRLSLVALGGGGLLLSACGSGTSTSSPVSATPAPTTTASPPATLPPSTAPPGTSIGLSGVEAHLTARTPPAKSALCDTAPAVPTSTTTVPARSPAGAWMTATAGIGFPQLNGSSPHYTKFSGAPPFCINVADTYTAVMKTTAGTITVDLLPKYAPVTVNSFVFLAGYHFFDGIVFHRVITGFVDQGGDPTGTGTGGPGYSFDDELPKSAGAYDPGALAMANSGADTNGSQFFFVVGSGGEQLSPAYSVYGQVVSGLDAVNKINSEGSSAGTPKILNRIESVTIEVNGH